MANRTYSSWNNRHHGGDLVTVIPRQDPKPAEDPPIEELPVPLVLSGHAGKKRA